MATAAAPARELIDARYAQAFDQFDVTGARLLTRDGLLSVGNQLLSAFRTDLTVPKGAALVGGILHFWDRLARAAGKPIDDPIDEQDFIAAMGVAFRDDQRAYFDHMEPMINAIVDLMDLHDDGRIGREAFTAMQIVLGASVATIGPAFDALNLYGEGYLRRRNLSDALRNFYVVSSPNAYGTAVFALEQPRQLSPGR